MLGRRSDVSVGHVLNDNALAGGLLDVNIVHADACPHDDLELVHARKEVLVYLCLASHDQSSSLAGGGNFFLQREARPIVHVDGDILKDAKRVLAHLVGNEQQLVFGH